MIPTILAGIGVIVLSLCVGLAARWLWALYTRRLSLGAPDVWDAIEADVLEHVDALTGKTLVLDAVPVQTPEPDRMAIAARAAEFEWLKTYLLTTLERRYLRPGRHRAVGLTDPHRAALQAPTQAFRQIVWDEYDTTLTEVGPRESELRCVRTVGFVEAVA